MPTLTVEDAKAIISEVPAVKYVAPNLSGVAQVVYGNQNWSTNVTGTTPEALDIREWPVVSGRPFTQQDVEGATKGALLGKTVILSLQDNGVPWPWPSTSRVWAAGPWTPIIISPRIDVDEEEIRRINLPPFSAAVSARVCGIMTSHALYPALDPDLPATLSPGVLTHLLR